MRLARGRAVAFASLAGVVGAGLLTALLPAIAADISVTVTGTNIRRTDIETASPVAVITREMIERSGFSSLAQVLHAMPADNNGTISNAFTNGFAASAEAVSLRGLGAGNTLVLLNGRRLASFALADDAQRSFVNVGNIPLAAIDRVEVLKDGASAIYGSDALAGVVNIILREHFAGALANASGGTSYQGDGNTYTADLMGGAGSLETDRFNVFGLLNYRKQHAIGLAARPEYVGNSDLTSMGKGDHRGGDPTNAFAPTWASLLGNVSPILPSGEMGPFQSLPGSCAGQSQSGQFCAWDPKSYRQVQPDTEQANFYGRGTMIVLPDIRAYAEAAYFHSSQKSTNTPSEPATVWPDVRDATMLNTFGNDFLPVGHPDNPFNGVGQRSWLGLATADLGGRNQRVTTDAQRYVVGLTGTTGSWDWDAGAYYTSTRTDVQWHGFIRYSHFVQALEGRGGFGYYRIGANAGLNDPGMRDFISPALTHAANSSLAGVDLKATRTLTRLPGGPLGLAIGAEYRREEVDNPGDPFTFEGDIVGLGYTAAKASRNVFATYAELDAPITKSVELSAALRYDRYSDVGSSTTPKVGVRWNVLPALLLRGTYAQGFRAPGPYESGNSTAPLFTTFVDPIRCPVTGFATDCGSGFTVQLSSGNREIKPETADTYTAGFVVEPIAGLSATVDYYYIKRKNEIVQLDVQTVLNNPGLYPAAHIFRGNDTLPGIPESGSLSGIVTPYTNANQTMTDGVDVDVRYRWKSSSYGTWTLSGGWTHIFRYERRFDSGQQFDYAGSHGPTALSSAAGMPKDRALASLGIDYGAWSATLWMHYIGPMEDKEFRGADCTHPVESGPNCHVASFTTFDLTGSYKGFREWEVYASIHNVLDRKPPFDYQAGYALPFYNFNYAQAGAIGTFYTVGLRYTFQ